MFDNSGDVGLGKGGNDVFTNQFVFGLFTQTSHHQLSKKRFHWIGGKWAKYSRKRFRWNDSFCPQRSKTTPSSCRSFTLSSGRKGRGSAVGRRKNWLWGARSTTRSETVRNRSSSELSACFSADQSSAPFCSSCLVSRKPLPPVPGEECENQRVATIPTHTH